MRNVIRSAAQWVVETAARIAMWSRSGTDTDTKGWKTVKKLIQVLGSVAVAVISWAIFTACGFTVFVALSFVLWLFGQEMDVFSCLAASAAISVPLVIYALVAQALSKAGD